MYIKKIHLLVSIIMLSISSSYATEHWTGEIKWINVDENGIAYIYINNPRGSSSPTFNCGSHNIVYLGAKNVEVNKSLLSLAMTVYATSKTIRFGVRGSGDSCETPYISAR